MPILLVLLFGVLVSAGERETKVDAIFQPFATGASPGCAVGVLERGETVLARGYGLADIEHKIPLTTSSRFYMASVSKQFTALAALIAESEGKLSLADSVRKWIPELPESHQAITLRRMLDHTAGLRDYLTLWSLKGWTNESVLREGPTLSLVARQRALDFAPGTSQSYSNTGYFLMALVIHRATGMTLGDYTREKILTPLGMTATSFQHDHAHPVPERAHGYRQASAGVRIAGVNFDIAGSGGLYSNIDDMLKWARNFDQPRVAASLLPVLQTPGTLTDGTPTPGGYALGISRQTRGGLTVVSHGGAATGYTTHFLWIPERRLAVTVLCNGSPRASRFANEAAEVYLGSRFPAVESPGGPEGSSPVKPQPASAEDRKRLAGAWWSDELEAVWRFLPGTGPLLLQSEGAEAPVLKTGHETFRAGPATLRLTSPNTLAVDAGRAKGITFTRR